MIYELGILNNYMVCVQHAIPWITFVSRLFLSVCNHSPKVKSVYMN